MQVVLTPLWGQDKILFLDLPSPGFAAAFRSPSIFPARDFYQGLLGWGILLEDRGGKRRLQKQKGKQCSPLGKPIGYDKLMFCMGAAANWSQAVKSCGVLARRISVRCPSGS